MKSVKEIIKLMKEEWTSPHFNNPEKKGFEYVCIFGEGANISVKQIPENIPADIIEFWSVSSNAELFKDVVYGQWGLRIFSIDEAIKEKKKILSSYAFEEYSEYDFIIGEFIGDSEYLLQILDKNSIHFGEIVVSLPLDDRKVWPVVAKSFTEFLNLYYKAAGEKYWESYYKNSSILN